MINIIYGRVSGDKQETEMQINACLNDIKRRENGNSFEYKIFEDPDMSSKVKMKNRKGLMEFLNSLQKGQHVVVYKLDRLSRDIIEMVSIYRMIKEKGCTIHSLNDPECDNEFIIGLMGVLAQKERKDISDRTKSALKNKKAKNERTGNYPYGFTYCRLTLVETKNKITGDKELKLGYLIPCPHEQSILDLMCQYFDKGNSYRQIAHMLTRQGYMNRKGNPFQHMSIYRILLQTGRTRSVDQPLAEIEYETFHAQSQ